MSNKTQLQINNTALDALITRVNAAKDVAASLPDADGTGESNMISVTLQGVIDMYYWDADGNIQKGHDGIVMARDGLIVYSGIHFLQEIVYPGQDGVSFYSRYGSLQSLRFSDFGTAQVVDNSG